MVGYDVFGEKQDVWKSFSKFEFYTCAILSLFPPSPGVGPGTQQVFSTWWIRPVCRIYGTSVLNDGILRFEKGCFWGGCFCLKKYPIEVIKAASYNYERYALAVINFSFQWQWHSWGQWKKLAPFLQFGETETFFMISFNKCSVRWNEEIKPMSKHAH